ncbi:MAG: hypothetical protein ACK461_09045, partial [Bacteroidota bacterium]
MLKRYITFFAVAALGGLTALGISKLFSDSQGTVLQQERMARFAGLSESSTRPDFVEVADL